VTLLFAVGLWLLFEFKSRFFRLTISTVMMLTSVYHLIFGEPWSEEMRSDRLKAINSRDYTVPITYATLFTSYTVVVCMGGCPLCAPSILVWSGFLLTLILATIDAALHTHGATEDGLSDAVDTVGFLVGIGGITEAALDRAISKAITY
jgi:hypothetical protein